MRIAGAKRSWRTVVICLVAAFLIIAGVLSICLSFPQERVWPTLGACASREGGFSEVWRWRASIKDDAPSTIARTVYPVLGPARWNGPSSVPESDVTVAEIRLTAGYAKERTWGWTRVGNRARRALGLEEAAEWTFAEKHIIGESERLYLRVTPDGNFYVSTAEDMEHAIHEGLIADDANVAANVTSICQDYWADWVSNMDSLVQRSLASQ